MNEIATYGESAVTTFQPSVTSEMATSRQAQEVQAAVFMAKKFPRNENAAFSRIMQACQRVGLAEQAVYEYPKGNQSVTGPSIRLAETLARAWGNCEFGITELEQRPGESTVMAFCWDLETNARQTKIFTVPHVRHTKKGITPLTDPRDIYEVIANQGARRLRSCILGIIPGDITDAALQQCQKTLASGSKEPLADRVRKMIHFFQDEFGVPQSCLESYIGCKAEAFTEQAVVRLRGVYTSLKEGRASREAYFDIPAADDPAPIDVIPEAPAPAPAPVTLEDL